MFKIFKICKSMQYKIFLPLLFSRHPISKLLSFFNSYFIGHYLHYCPPIYKWLFWSHGICSKKYEQLLCLIVGIKKEIFKLRTLLLKMWSPDGQYQHHHLWEACWKCRILSSIPDRRMQNYLIYFNKMPNWFVHTGMHDDTTSVFTECTG